MPPGGGTQAPGIVVGEAAPFQTIIGELIPFLARYFTGLTSNAYRPMHIVGSVKKAAVFILVTPPDVQARHYRGLLSSP
jgi:hypothetical protein